MSALLNINDRQVGQHQIPTVNARELHTFLENRDHFATWIKDRIDQYGFFAGMDFVSFSESSEKGGRPRVEFAVTLDMAKELSMVERNEKGKQARQYFIACERRAKAAPALPNFADPVAAARAWADAEEGKRAALVLVQQQTAQLEAAKPAMEFVERYVKADGPKGVRQVCQLLNVNEREFVSFLMGQKIMYRLDGVLTPMAHHRHTGRFVVKAGLNRETDHVFNQAKFTPFGIEWVAGEWAKFQIREQKEQAA